MAHHLALLFFFTTPTTLPHYDVAVSKGVKHRVYLTIDDHPTTTSMAMLRVLKRCKLKATFFLLGTSEWYYRKNPKYKPLQRRHKSLLAIHKAGHTLGNHTVTHANLCKIKRSKVRWELKTTQWLIRKALGVNLTYWRPPFMASCRVARQEARKLKLKLVWAHVDDLHGSAKMMWFRVKRRSRRGKKSTIMLFHKNVKKFKAFLKLSGLCPHPLPPPVRPRSR
jgi:peptidoglycan/xylan/chitin deacetylase (PgdA/CDA1 family)